MSFPSPHVMIERDLLGVREGYVIDSANVSIDLFHVKYKRPLRQLALISTTFLNP
jgi:hypothetical protein